MELFPRDKGWPWPGGTKVRVIRLFPDDLYFSYGKTSGEGLTGIISPNNWSLYFPGFCRSYYHVEAVRLDDPDENY